MKKIGIIVIIILALSVIACMSGTEENAKKISTDTETTEEKKKEKEIFKIGDEIKLGDNIIRVNRIEKSQGEEFDKPQAGHEFICIYITIKNGGKEEISYNPFDFTMENSKGNIKDNTWISLNNYKKLQDGKLSKGGEVDGWLIYEEPIDDKLKLRYEPNFWTNKKIEIDLN